MNLDKIPLKLIRLLFSIIIFYCIGCSNQKTPLTNREAKLVADSVQKMMGHVSNDLLNGGPVAWEKYFERSSHFFMASEGQLVFPNIDSASSFIKNTLTKQVNKVDLKWSNIQIDPLSTTIASVAANWHEDITDVSGDTNTQDGFFTAIAEQTSVGWQFRNAHWSAKK